MNLTEIQAALRDGGHQAWLFYDHHHRDPIAYRVLGLPPDRLTTRRWFYVIPANGEPVKLVHRIESHHLDSLPGSKMEYSAWEELWANLEAMVKPYSKVVMQYSPNNQIPYISLVDAGMLELIRGFGKEIVTSANLVARFEATLTEAQIASHYKAQTKVDAITAGAFQEIGRRARNGGTHEFEIQQWIMEAFKREDLITCDPPNVSVNAHSGDPHYEPSSASSGADSRRRLRPARHLGQVQRARLRLLRHHLDRRDRHAQRQAARDLHHRARRARRGHQQGEGTPSTPAKPICGWEVDQAVHDHIVSKGYGPQIFHRTGHSITSEIHGNGANLDNLETKDDRLILPNTCFSVEPGVYFPDFGVRSEIDMMIRNGKAEVTGRIQNELVLI